MRRFLFAFALLAGALAVSAPAQPPRAPAAPATPAAVDAQLTTAWLHRQIMFENEPLDRVVSEFNRYAPKPIEIATPALRNLEVSGVFATDNSDALVAFLRSLEGVKVEVTATRILVSQR